MTDTPDTPIHADCGHPLTINRGGSERVYPDGTADTSSLFYCRHCDGYPPIDGMPPLNIGRYYHAALHKVTP